MSTKAKTITVDGYFSKIELTREQFIKRWLDHINEFKRLDWAPEWQTVVYDFEYVVTAKAGEEFDKTYASQNQS